MPGPNQSWGPGGPPVVPGGAGSALGSLRRLWWATVGYQAVLGGVLLLAPPVGSLPGLGRGLAVASVVLMVTVLPLAMFARNQFYKRNWRGQAITPHGYWGGNLVLLAGADLVVFVGLLALLFRESWWPAAVPTLVGFALELLNYPHGRPMRDAGGGR